MTDKKTTKTQKQAVKKKQPTELKEDQLASVHGGVPQGHWIDPPPPKLKFIKR